MLTERWNGRGLEAAGLAASSGGGEERGSWPGLLRRSSGRRGCRIRLAASLGRRTRVIGVQDSTAASKSRRAPSSPTAALLAEFDCAGAALVVRAVAAA